jgi:hypothetical protein
MRPRVLALAALLAAAAPAGCGKKAPPEDPKFRVAIQSKVAMDVGAEKQDIEADAAFEYTWARDGQVRTLLVNAAEVRAAMGGKEMMNAKMTRDGFTDSAGGRKKEIKTAEANEQLKKILTDSFGTPVCKIELDAEGREVKRTVVAGAGAATLIDSGMIANARMFHPSYPADKDEWEDTMEVSTGNGLASGKVAYKKVPGGKGGQAVKVSGTLTADGVKGTGGITINEAAYKVDGEQTYDTERKEWVKGHLTMDIAFKMTHAGRKGTAKGSMDVTFGLLP